MINKIIFAVIACLACSAHAELKPMPPAAASCPGLTTKEMSVSKAYLALFGRAPDLAGLKYWTTRGNGLPEDAGVAQAVNFIAISMSGGNLAPINIVTKSDGTFTEAATWDQFIEYAYVFILGKGAAEDPQINYWQNQQKDVATRSSTPGDLIVALLNAANATAAAEGGDKFHNKMTMLEAASRLQLCAQHFSLGYQDTQTIIRRVTENGQTFDDAAKALNNLTSTGVASAPGPRWETSGTLGPYTPARVLSESTALANGGTIHKSMVWYNRSGRMMLANVFLPPNYSTTGLYPAIISVHGGGWREGFIEKMHEYNAAFTQSSGQFIVFAPSYALSSYTYTSPESQNDIDDFISLVKSSVTLSTFRSNTSQVNFFGVSSGGHLLNLIGSTKSLGNVATLYPVSDLNSAANFNFLLPFINSYLNGVVADTVSPTKVWLDSQSKGSGISTKFFIQHGDADSNVPMAQSTAFVGAVPSNYKINCPVPGGGHGFYKEYDFTSPGRRDLFNKVASKVVSFFNTGLFPNCTY
ncbi:alpha/beta hydrolase [Undibacterium terreum]|uniref:alpha/beta hydrolase n=1 Tax=Undibacterium terreum TaxID=1224302 RepID=UPI00166BF81B|nr:prolyl oligopeptidase family serine peptidase [Undibacterium terreum]